MIAQNLVRVSVESEIKRRIDTIRNADPQFFGGTKSSMTPTQALLVTYSVVTDDSLAGNQTALTQNMQNSQQLRSEPAETVPRRAQSSMMICCKAHNVYSGKMELDYAKLIFMIFLASILLITSCGDGGQSPVVTNYQNARANLENDQA